MATVVWPTEWPEKSLVDVLCEGEAWISKDLVLLDHPKEYWIEDESGRGLRPTLARDFALVMSTSTKRTRCFRRLDQDWLAWLSRAVAAARPKMAKEQPELCSRSPPGGRPSPS